MSGNDDDQENSGIRPADREAHLRQIQSDGVVSTQPLYQPHEGDTITGKMRTVKIEEDARFDLNDGSIDVVVEEELMPLTQPEEMVDLIWPGPRRSVQIRRYRRR